ncbi:MAG: hypothetical protein ACRDYU_14280, partial [Actinomycetes bacterium]
AGAWVARTAGRAARPLGRVASWTPVVAPGVHGAVTVLTARGRVVRRGAEADAARFLEAVVPAVVDAVVARVDIDAIAARVDVDAIIARVDLVRLAQEVVEDLDLPAIVRESTGSMASESVRGVRLQSIDADERVNRIVDRVLLRRGPRRTVAPDET